MEPQVVEVPVNPEWQKGLDLAMAEGESPVFIPVVEEKAIEVAPVEGASEEVEEPTQKEEAKEDVLEAVVEEKVEPAPVVEKHKHGKEKIYGPNETKEQIIHRLKTTDGMFKSANRKALDLEKENAELKQRFEALDNKKTTPEEEPVVGQEVKKPVSNEFLETIENLPAVQKLKEDYGEEISGALTNIAKHIFDNLSGSYEGKLKEMNAMITPLFESQQVTAAENHYLRIQKAHPDAITKGDDGVWESPYTNEIQEWVGTLPAYKQAAYKNAYTRGSAEEIIDMLGDFKQAMGYVDAEKAPAPVVKPKPVINKAQLEETVKINSRTSPIATANANKAGSFESGVQRAWADN